jgi:hypothetical protein
MDEQPACGNPSKGSEAEANKEQPQPAPKPACQGAWLLGHLLDSTFGCDESLLVPAACADEVEVASPVCYSGQFTDYCLPGSSH